MADNANLPDAAGVSFTVRLKDNAGVKLPIHNAADPTGVNLQGVDVNGRAQVTTEGAKATYRYVVQSFAMVAAPTDAIIVQGSATKTVSIKRIRIAGQATAQGSMPVSLVKRTAADSGGTAVLTGITAAKHDSADGAATAVVSSVGTGNFGALGAGVLFAAERLGMSPLGTGTAGGGQSIQWHFSDSNDKPLKLRGTAEFACINFNGAAIPAGGVIDVTIETEEDAS